MKTLYHGSNVDFTEVLLSKCLPHKDFGKGFYLTPSRYRARLRALDKVDKEHEGVPTIMRFDFDESALAGMMVLEFERCDQAWLDFILSNRNRRNKAAHGYDVVIGPVADDGVITSISLYEAGVIGRQELLVRLQGVKAYVQYAFCSQRAIDLLVRK